MPTFRNLHEFYKLMVEPTNTAIDYVCDKILTELEVQLVNQGIGTHDSFYENTGEFYEAWKQSLVQRVGDYISSKVYYDENEVTAVPERFTHGSFYWTGGDDVSNILPDLIFGGKSGDLFGTGYWTDKRDAWTPTMNRLDRSFNKWIKEGFKKGGFNIF